MSGSSAGGKSQSASLRRRLHAGNFPLRFAPDQVRVTPNDDEALINYAKPIVAELR
jgi:threonyl-tRNA synthetase